MTERLRRVLFVLLAGVLCLGLCSCQDSAGVHPEMPDVNVSRWQDVTDGFMGDWQGSYEADDGSGDLVARVIGHGEGNYRINIYSAFDTDERPIHVLDGVLKDNVYTYTSDGGAYKGKGTLKGDTFKCNYEGPVNGVFEMKKVERLSPRLGATAPVGAIVLFDGTSTDQWQHPGKRGPVTWLLVDDAMEAVKGSIVTKKKFKDFELHLEFRTPYMPKARGQDRGNSGVYVRGGMRCRFWIVMGLRGSITSAEGSIRLGGHM